MLGTLCTLITVLSCVSGVTVVTQKPPVLTVSKGDTATMDCNLGTVTTSAARWYKQVPGEFLSMCCVSTMVTALLNMELDSPPPASHPIIRVNLIID
ncbi:hypothetical protein COCON_G00207380 [Conger conger]|uniref:Ig-like domain-containing protein n=1 Tax=Conger conger TaxID=82655 RepID=A0A9Q1CZY4_CONCO|nr:hypothetical protein COCON_G00207380 [Conger conger]